MNADVTFRDVQKEMNNLEEKKHPKLFSWMTQGTSLTGQFSIQNVFCNSSKAPFQQKLVIHNNQFYCFCPRLPTSHACVR